MAVMLWCGAWLYNGVNTSSKFKCHFFKGDNSNRTVIAVVFTKRATSKGKNLLLMSKFLPFRVDPFWKGFITQGKGSYISRSPLWKWLKIMELYSCTLTLSKALQCEQWWSWSEYVWLCLIFLHCLFFP